MTDLHQLRTLATHICPLWQPLIEEAADELEKLRKKAPRKRKIAKPLPYKASDQAHQCLNEWARRRPLPLGAAREIYLKTFDDMVRLDGLPWADVGQIVLHAVTEWEPGWIIAPSKLRKPSTAYPELKTWQVIQSQLKKNATVSTTPSLTLEQMRERKRHAEAPH